MNYTTFNILTIGKKFKAPTGVVYQKISVTESKPVRKANNQIISNGLSTTIFYNSNIQVVEVV